MQDKLETVDPHLLGAVSGAAMTNAAMSSLVRSRLHSNFGDQGFVQLVGKPTYGPNRHGTVMGHGKFSISDNFRGVEMRSWNAVMDVNAHRSSTSIPVISGRRANLDLQVRDRDRVHGNSVSDAMQRGTLSRLTAA